MTLISMPNVFVYPPEEDEIPPYCCFDAAQSIPYTPTQADLDAPGSALEFVSQSIHSNTPIFYRKDIHSEDVVMPRRRSIIGEHDYHLDSDITIRGNSPGNDSEIVEVVKVRRHSNDSRALPESTAKQPKGLKARASKVFGSFRKISRSKKGDSTEDSLPSRAPSPSPISRRPSLVLSNLFSRPQGLRSSSSFDSLTESAPSTPSTTTPPHTFSSSSSISTQIHNPPSSDMHDFVPYASDDDDDYEEDEQDEEVFVTPRARRCMTPTSQTSQTSKSARRRFSVLNLFTLSSSQPSIATSPSTPTLPMSRESLGPSSDSSSSSSASSAAASSGPTTPIEENFPPPPPSPSPITPSRTSSSLLRRLSFTKRRDVNQKAPPQATVEVAIDENDMSFGEMRLDSLHFSELSFDAGKF